MSRPLGRSLKPPVLPLSEAECVSHPNAFRCQLCRLPYPLTIEFFGPFRRNASGFDHRCRNCTRAKDRAIGTREYRSGTPGCYHCTRPLFRVRRCLRCWAGMIYGGIRDRVTGKHPYKGRKYIGLPLEFTRPEFVRWVTNNPPPLNMEQPSVDRIEESLGYTLTNIQWMPTRQNARKHFKHLGLKPL